MNNNKTTIYKASNKDKVNTRALNMKL